VQFEGVTLGELVARLQDRNKEAGNDPNLDPLNVVISPGLENQPVPALSLRNVSPTDVLTVATTVLGLHIEPVMGDSGQPVAWLIKAAEGSPFGPANVAKPPPVAAPGGGAGDAGGGFTVPAFGDGAAALAPGEEGRGGIPYAVQLAASPPTSATGAGAGMAPPRATSRVFGVASLIASDDADPQPSEKGRAEKLHRLIHSLEKMAVDQGGEAQISAYDEMDILVVKSADPAALALIAEAIEAMKTNIARSGDSGRQSREDALRAEISALSGRLSVIQTEKDAQRQTLLDQIELLKAAHKGEDASRTKR
jgi:hypothetical protein